MQWFSCVANKEKHRPIELEFVSQDQIGQRYKLVVLLTMLLSVFISGMLFSVQTQAAEKMNACFEATKSCEALRSIRCHTNPGNIHLEVGTQYPLVARNKANAATHYQLILSGIASERRWVEVACGRVLESCDSSNGASVSVPASDEYLLAISWQPSFCETHENKPECRTLTSERYDAHHLALHGLWPQPRSNAYCGVSETDKSIDRRSRWDLLQPLSLDNETRERLAIVMPGYASNLQRHEWIKHGTCYGKNENGYYADSIQLLDEINNSAIAALFDTNIGKRINLTEVRQHFDQVFGSGSGNKVNMRCDRKGRIGELHINLKGDVHNDLSLQQLLKNAADTESQCKSGIVDPA